LEAADRRAKTERHAAPSARLGERVGEFMAVTRFIRRAVQPAMDFSACGRERGIDLDHAREIEHMEFLSAVLENLHVLDAGIEGRLVAIEEENSSRVAVILDRGIGDRLVQNLLGILTEAQLVESVCLCSLGRAVAQKAQAPRPHLWIGSKRQPKRLVALKKR